MEKTKLALLVLRGWRIGQPCFWGYGKPYHLQCAECDTCWSGDSIKELSRKVETHRHYVNA